MYTVNTQPNKSLLHLERGKFNFAITGQAIGNELEIFELLHFAMTELNLTCEFIKLHWHVLISNSEDEL